MDLEEKIMKCNGYEWDREQAPGRQILSLFKPCN